MHKIPVLFGPYGSGAVASIERFAQYGANALWFHGFDPRAFDACQQHGVAPCVEFKTFRADFDARPELIPIGVDGRPIRYGSLVQGVCLSQQDFLDETEAHLVEGLQDFQPTGVWLDYLTYAGWFEDAHPDLQDSCFCPACIAEFCESNGVDADTPAEILRTFAYQWEDHKCERIAAFARRYAAIIHDRLPGCIVGAYMCPWRPEEWERALTRIFAQDYDLLSASIDVFTPLIYATKSGRPAAWAREFLEASPRFVPSGSPVQLILDVLEFPASLQAAADSAVPTHGVQLYGGAQVFADPAQAAQFAAAVEKIRRNLA